jgi:hypothetical protein
MHASAEIEVNKGILGEVERISGNIVPLIAADSAIWKCYRSLMGQPRITAIYVFI